MKLTLAKTIAGCSIAILALVQGGLRCDLAHCRENPVILDVSTLALCALALLVLLWAGLDVVFQHRNLLWTGNWHDRPALADKEGWLEHRNSFWMPFYHSYELPPRWFLPPSNHEEYVPHLRLDPGQLPIQIDG